MIKDMGLQKFLKFMGVPHALDLNITEQIKYESSHSCTEFLKVISQAIDGQEQQHTGPTGVKGKVSPPIIDPAQARVEWIQLKNLVVENMYPRDNMRELWQLIVKYHKPVVPNMVILGYIAMSTLLHTSQCERDFSVQNSILTAKRVSTDDVTCDRIMRVMIQGPRVEEWDPGKALDLWKKKRRLLLNQTKKD